MPVSHTGIVTTVYPHLTHQTFVAHYTRRQYITAIQEFTVAGEAFQDLDQTVTPEHRALWLEQEKSAHETRLDDVAAMDIYMTELSTGKKWHGYGGCERVDICLSSPSTSGH